MPNRNTCTMLKDVTSVSDKKKIVHLIVFLSVAFAAMGNDHTSKSILDTIEEGRNRYFNGEYIASLRIFAEMPDASTFDRAVTEYYLGRIAVEIGDLRRARSRFEATEQLLSLAFTEAELSDVYALRADTKSQLLLIRGISYVIRNSGKIRALAETSLKFNPDNALATLVIARGKINAPWLFGGSVSVGIGLIEDVLEIDHLDRFEQFLAHYSLAVAYEKERQYDLAAAQISVALALYPENPDALELLGRLNH